MKNRFAAWACPVRQDARVLRSSDGSVIVSLQRAGQGVFIERITHRPGAARVTHATVFSSPKQLRRWCDADAMRFEHPLVLQDLMRHAEELFDSTDADRVPG